MIFSFRDNLERCHAWAKLRLSVLAKPLLNLQRPNIPTTLFYEIISKTQLKYEYNFQFSADNSDVVAKLGVLKKQMGDGMTL